jgi:ubiquinone/menaquinone biosynthesis C-methylase UbiE
MPSQKEIYDQHADQYDRLVSREDCQNNILRTLRQIVPLDGVDVVELGAGTGRLTRLLAPQVKSILAFDASHHMLGVAAAKLEKGGWQNWQVGVADHRHLPTCDRTADVVIAGWSICYLVVWHEETWRDEVNRALAEMRRVLRPGGTIVILETLGTGRETPHVLDSVAAYFPFLENAGFSSTWTRTDFQFESLEEAETLIHFFFGEEMAARVVKEQLVTLPECTGFWYTCC